MTTTTFASLGVPAPIAKALAQDGKTAPFPIQRDTLEAGIDAWNRYMDVLRASNEDRALILEFVRGDDPEVFLRDAATLNRLARA